MIISPGFVAPAAGGGGGLDVLASEKQIAQNTTDITFNHTIAVGTNCVVVIAQIFSDISADTVTFSTPTYNGTAMDLAVAAYGRRDDGSRMRGVGIWYMTDPPAGSQEVIVNDSVDTSSDNRIGCYVLDISGVDTADPVNTTASDSTAEDSPPDDWSVGITTTGNDTLLIGSRAAGSTSAMVAGSGVTEVDSEALTGGLYTFVGKVVDHAAGLFNFAIDDGGTVKPQAIAVAAFNPE